MYLLRLVSCEQYCTGLYGFRLVVLQIETSYWSTSAVHFYKGRLYFDKVLGGSCSLCRLLTKSEGDLNESQRCEVLRDVVGSGINIVL